MQTVIHAESITPIQTCTIQGSFRTQNSQVERTKHGTCRTHIIQVKCTLNLSKIKKPKSKLQNMEHAEHTLPNYNVCKLWRIPKQNTQIKQNEA